MFGFDFVERDLSLKKNFLKSVIVQINFDKIQNYINFKDKVIAQFKDNFPRISESNQDEYRIEFKPNHTPILSEKKGATESFEMKSSSGQEILKISNNSVAYVTSGQRYQSFEKILAISQELSEIILFFGVRLVNRLSIRKLNIIEFNEVSNPTEILNFILNPELLSNLNYFPNNKFIRQNIHSVNYVNNSYYLNIRYGLNQLPPTYELGQIILDIDLFNTNSISISDIGNELKKINQEIFNVFIWAISENTKQILHDE